MTVKAARDVARAWVVEEASRLPGFRGAFNAGSTHWLPDDADVPADSDVDVMVVLRDPDVLDDPSFPARRGKFLHRGVLLEASYLPADRVRDADAVLGDYHLAGAFRAPGIILDPTGHLARLHETVAGEFAKPHQVRRRCAAARDRVLRNVTSFDTAPTLHAQVTAWLFAAGVTTHVLLVAGLRNPTVRRRYVAVRELLADYRQLDVYPALLDLLGCAGMGRARVAGHLETLGPAFDAAAVARCTPVPFASDLTPAARPVAIDGSRALIDAGLHREAIFWIVATWARCQQVLHADAPPEVRERHEPGFRALLADLGITSPADLRRGNERTIALLPRIERIAEAIIAANPAIDR